MKRQKEELNFLQEITERLVSRTERFGFVNPFVPFQIEVLEHSPYISRSIGEINFWQNTSATIVGVKRGQELFISPGPYITIEPKDIIYFIGNDESLERVEKFLHS
ncbi:cation:proton antiporter regulatory subunit [Ureibacillus acetophenoni]